jgi:glycosyltransferase involved in cell wall biosynthesis
VLYVSTLPGAGPVAHLRNLVPAVVAAGAGVEVVCANDALRREFEALGARAHALPLRHKLDLAAARRVWPLLEGVDVVHTHDRRAGLLVRPPARARGARVVHTYHGLPEELAMRVGREEAPDWPGASPARAAWLRHGYLRLEAALARLGVVVVPSRALARFLASHGLPEGRIRVIPSGVDVRRHEPGARHEPLEAATAAVLYFHKGVDVLLEACARVAAPLRLHVFGDGELRGALEERARRLEVDAVFHGTVADLRSRLPNFDVFVLPSRGENLPIVLLEAMAAAVPVVATRVGGVPELVEDGSSGLLAEPDDPEALAGALERLAGNEELRLALGRGGAARVAEAFSTAEMGRRTVALYEELREAA